MGRAIVRQPQVFLFDEPLSNLDAKLRAQTRLEIQKLHRELGITSLFVTHDQVEAMTLAQRIIVMNGGVMDQFGTPEEVYARPATTFVASFIGSPPMNLLKHAPGVRPGTILGIRPEHLDLDATAGRVQVEYVELLGAERLIYGRIGDEQMIMRADEGQTPPRTGDTIRIAARQDRLHWFDAGSGQANLPWSRRPWPYPRWIAHRGAGKLAPENTLAAFRLGAEHGYRMFECDAKLSADGVPFLLHDATLERTTNGLGVGRRAAVVRARAARCRQLAFARATPASRWPRSRTSRASACANGYLLNIEIKPTPGRRDTHRRGGRRSTPRGCGPTRPVPPLLDLLPARRAGGARRGAPDLAARPAAGQPVGGLARDRAPRSTASPSSATTRCGTPTPWRRRTAPACARLSYTVNDEWAAQRLIALGTDGIITDRVDLFAPH